MNADELVITIPGEVKLLLPSPRESSSCSTSGTAIPSSEVMSMSGWCRMEVEEVEGSSGREESYIDSVGVVNLNILSRVLGIPSSESGKEKVRRGSRVAVEVG